MKVAALEYILYIHYSIQFYKNWGKIQTLIDFRKKINAIITGYIFKLSFVIKKTNICTQKIDGSTFTAYKIVITGFLLQVKLNKYKVMVT